MRSTAVALSALALAVSALPARAQPADLVIWGGPVHTGEAGQPRAEAVAVSAGRIAYVGDRAATLTTDGVRLPAYWKAKAAVEYGLTPQVTARVEVDNLFDETYASSGFSDRTGHFPGDPRSVFVELTRKW